MPSTWTNGGLKRIWDRAAGTVDVLNDTIKVMLLGTAYVPNPDHEFISDILATELSGTGYVGGFGGSGRKTLAGKTLTTDTTLNEVRFDFTNPTWAGADFGTVNYAAIVKEVTTNADSPVLGILDTGPLLTSGGTFTLDVGTHGLKLKA